MLLRIWTDGCPPPLARSMSYSFVRKGFARRRMQKFWNRMIQGTLEILKFEVVGGWSVLVQVVGGVFWFKSPRNYASENLAGDGRFRSSLRVCLIHSWGEASPEGEGGLEFKKWRTVSIFQLTLTHVHTQFKTISGVHKAPRDCTVSSVPVKNLSRPSRPYR